MKRTALAFYLANWYALAVCGLVLALQHPSGSMAQWLADLPWTSWGTQGFEALIQGEALSGGALWLLMGASLAAVGVIGSLLASLHALTTPASATPQAKARRRAAPGAINATPGDAAALSEQGDAAAGLVEDPQLRQLIQQLNTRLG